MSTTSDLPALDLSALVASRICHDIISPIGAITNGLEVLEEDNGEDMRAFAMDLIVKSAKQASAKLQFARIAFGAAGSAGSEIDLGDAQKVAVGFFENEKADLAWTAPRVLMPKNQVKLLLNLLLVGISTVPRGGTVSAHIDITDTKPVFTITCTGLNARIPSGLQSTILGELEENGVDAHSIQPFYTGLLARAAGMNVEFSLDGETVTLKASPNSST